MNKLLVKLMLFLICLECFPIFSHAHDFTEYMEGPRLFAKDLISHYREVKTRSVALLTRNQESTFPGRPVVLNSILDSILEPESRDLLFPAENLEADVLEVEIVNTIYQFLNLLKSTNELGEAFLPAKDRDGDFEGYSRRIHQGSTKDHLDELFRKYNVSNALFMKPPVLKSFWESEPEHYKAVFEAVAQTPIKSLIVAFVESTNQSLKVQEDFFINAGFDAGCVALKSEAFQKWLLKTQTGEAAEVDENEVEALSLQRDSFSTVNEYVQHVLAVIRQDLLPKEKKALEKYNDDRKKKFYLDKFKNLAPKLKFKGKSFVVFSDKNALTNFLKTEFLKTTKTKTSYLKDLQEKVPHASRFDRDKQKVIYGKDKWIFTILKLRTLIAEAIEYSII